MAEREVVTITFQEILRFIEEQELLDHVAMIDQSELILSDNQ